MIRILRRCHVKALYRLRTAHRKLGRMAEFSHLAYFIVLFAESKYMYAKLGVACAFFSVLYMMSDTEGKTK